MGFWGAVKKVGSTIGDVAEDIGDGMADAAKEVGGTAKDVAGNAGTAIGGTLGAAGTFVDRATFGAAGKVADTVDDVVFDTVDRATFGVVDVDFDNGNLTANVGIDDVLEAGASVGEDGVSTDAGTVGAGLNAGLTTDGMDLGATGGVNIAKVPYFDVDLDVSKDGDLKFDTEVQGTIPTYAGLLSGEVKAGVEIDDEGYGAYLDTEAQLRLNNGMVIGGGMEGSYVKTEDGSYASIDVDGSLAQPGLWEVGGSAGYERLEQGDVVLERGHADAYGKGYGVEVEAGVDYAAVETSDGRVSEWGVEVDVDGMDMSSALEIGAAVIEETGYEPPAEVTEAADDFSTAIETVDEIESSFDDMLDGLG